MVCPLLIFLILNIPCAISLNLLNDDTVTKPRALPYIFISIPVICA